MVFFMNEYDKGVRGFEKLLLALKRQRYAMQ